MKEQMENWHLIKENGECMCEDKNDGCAKLFIEKLKQEKQKSEIIGYEKGKKETLSELLNQPANQHDNLVRQELKEEFVAEFEKQTGDTNERLFQTSEIINIIKNK
jgi:hypothetical protein